MNVDRSAQAAVQDGETIGTDNNWEQYIVERGKLLTDWRSKQKIMKTLAEKWIYIESEEIYTALSLFTLKTPAAACRG